MKTAKREYKTEFKITFGSRHRRRLAFSERKEITMSKRSNPGNGDIVAIYQLGEAKEFCDSVVGGFNKTAFCVSLGEDYADCRWPVVVKAKPIVTNEQLVQHLRDLADAIVKKGYFELFPGEMTDMEKRFLLCRCQINQTNN